MIEGSCGAMYNLGNFETTTTTSIKTCFLIVMPILSGNIWKHKHGNTYCIVIMNKYFIEYLTGLLHTTRDNFALETFCF